MIEVKWPCPECGEDLGGRDAFKCKHCSWSKRGRANDNGPTGDPTCQWHNCKFLASIKPGVLTGGGTGWCRFHYRCDEPQWGNEVAELSRQWEKGLLPSSMTTIASADGRKRWPIYKRMPSQAERLADEGQTTLRREEVTEIIRSLRMLVDGPRTVRYRDVDQYKQLGLAPLREKEIK